MIAEKCNNPAIQRCEDIRKISSFLHKRLKIAHFSYHRIYHDGSRSVLSSNAEYVLCNYLETDIFKRTYTPQYYYPHKYFYIPEWVKSLPKNINEDIEASLIVQKNQADIANEFVILNRYDNFWELFIFASYADEINFLNHCINHLSDLNAFIIYFTSNASDLINEAISHPIIQPWLNDQIIKKTQIYSGKKQIQQNNQKIYLTHREFQCANLVIKGKTCKEIAHVLNISPRTVEIYLRNLKMKFSCQSKSHLIECLLKTTTQY